MYDAVKMDEVDVIVVFNDYRFYIWILFGNLNGSCGGDNFMEMCLICFFRIMNKRIPDLFDVAIINRNIRLGKRKPKPYFLRKTI